MFSKCVFREQATETKQFMKSWRNYTNGKAHEPEILYRVGPISKLNAINSS